MRAGRAKARLRERRHTFTTTADEGVCLLVRGKQPVEIEDWGHRRVPGCEVVALCPALREVPV